MFQVPAINRKNTEAETMSDEMNAKQYWPQTLKEFKCQAKIVDVSFPPYSLSRYKSPKEAERVCVASGEVLYIDNWSLLGLPK